LRKNRRNPNLKQNSESSFKSRVRICLYVDESVAVSSPRSGKGVILTLLYQFQALDQKYLYADDSVAVPNLRWKKLIFHLDRRYTMPFV
jgi:hypothetical protein